jgi:hemerythrin
MQLTQVSFEPMNEVHNREAEILEKLLKAIEKKEPLNDVYEEFVKDVENHFSFEEKLMEKYNFFAIVPHKMEHQKILNELYEIKKDLNNYEKIEKYFNEQFIPWLNNHIETIDTVTAGFFKMTGVTI